MVISLYICQIPEDISAEDLRESFRQTPGFLDIRVKTVSDKNKIAFVDYDSEENASNAKDIMQSFKFHNDDQGILIKFADNSQFSRNVQKKERKGNNFFHKNLTNKKRRRSNSSEFSDSGRGKKTDFQQNKTYASKSSADNSNDLLLKLLQQNLSNQDDNNALNQLSSLLSNINPSNKQSKYSYSKSSSLSDIGSSVLSKQEQFINYYESIKNSATRTVFVEGIPLDATEREVAHIFRPFPGFLTLRLVSKIKDGQKKLLCFADFENNFQSTICVQTLQGYRFDKNDLVGLHFSYGDKKK